jgi:hypothetical protein
MRTIVRLSPNPHPIGEANSPSETKGRHPERSEGSPHLSLILKPSKRRVISTGAMDGLIVHRGVERPPHFAFAVTFAFAFAFAFAF